MPLKRFFIVRSLVFAACAAAVFSTPVHADALQDIGKLLKQGQQAQALEQVDKYLSSKPKDAQGRFLKGVILTEMNKLPDAAAVFTKLTEDYPELPEPYNNLAVIYAQQKQYEKAKQALEMAIRTHPSYATAHENLGDIYARLATQAYDKALQLDSSNSSAQIKLATIKELMSVNTRPSAVHAAGKPAVVADTKPVEAKPAEAPAEPAKPVEAKPAGLKPDVKVAAAAPAPAPVAAPVAAPAKPAEAATGDGVAEVTKALDSWLAAWSKKDVKAYLAHYAKDFKTPGGEPRATWESERAQRIDKPGSIQVGYENLRVSVDGDTATAHFRQHYKSGALKTGSNKVVVLVRRDGRWLIQQERIGN
ncbi:MAG: tetratricopeptide repeat protein [Rhodocyclaceae bacterium]|nr:tetratricopeptide repeat protein [Rhodocyclaceae bacterium]